MRSVDLQPREPASSQRVDGWERLDAVVVGAGFAGLYMLLRLRDHLGLEVRAYEAGEDVGGTWYWNRYPGARCDSESYVYCYSFSPELLQEWDWSGRYPEQPELQAYLGFVADKFKLRPDIRFRTRVTSARFDEAAERWLVQTDTGERISAQFLITGVGLLTAAPYVPAMPGLESFRGERYHTGRWPSEPVSFAGKRVGVIGTGSTGVQTIPVIAEQAEELWVFQRSPQFAIPARHELVDRDYLAWVKAHYDEIWERTRWSRGGFPWEHNGTSALEATPDERKGTFDALWAEGGFKFIFGSYSDLLLDRRANDFAAEYVRARIRERVRDPAIAEKLLPVDHPFAARRPIVETNYYETYNRPNVHLVDVRHFPIRRLTPEGLSTDDGDYPLDLIVFATGFDAVTGPYLRIDIEGRGGTKLASKWATAPSSYLGLAVSGFPNLFTLTGPGSTFGNLPVAIEHHVEWVSGCIEYLREQSLSTIEAQQPAEDAWMRDIRSRAERTLTTLADSWLTGSNIPGKPRNVLIDFGSFASYRRNCDRIAEAGFSGFTLGGCEGPAPARVGARSGGEGT